MVLPQGRLRLQQRMVESEEEHSRLLQCHFEAEQELHSLEQNLDKTEDQKRQLQEDCKSLTEKISSISQGERSESCLCLCLVFVFKANFLTLCLHPLPPCRSSNDMLIQRIR